MVPALIEIFVAIVKSMSHGSVPPFVCSNTVTTMLWPNEWIKEVIIPTNQVWN